MYDVIKGIPAEEEEVEAVAEHDADGDQVLKFLHAHDPERWSSLWKNQRTSINDVTHILSFIDPSHPFGTLLTKSSLALSYFHDKQ